MKRRRYMTKRRIEEKNNRQRKVSLFMALAVMITAITLTYKNVDGDFSRLMGSAYTAKDECLKTGNKWYTRYSCITNDDAFKKENECKRLGGIWNKGYGCINSTNSVLNKYTENCYNKGEALDFKKLESATLSNPNTYCSKSSELRVNTNKVKLKVGEGFKVVAVPSSKENKIEYITENSKIATINPNSGVVKAVSGGTTKITIKDSKNNVSKVIEVSVSTRKVQDGLETTDDNNSKDDDLNISTPEVKKESVNGTIVSPKLTINSNKVVLYVNKTYQLKVTSNIKNDKIIYSSSDKDIVIVGSKGLIKGKKEGQAKITVTSSSGKKVETNIIVGKKFNIGVNYGPSSKVAVNKSNKVMLNVTDTKLTNVWVFDDKLNGNSIFEKEYEKVKTSGDIEIKNLPEKGKTKRYYVRTRDSAKLYSYTTFVVKNNNGKYNKSTGPTIKNVRGIQIGDEKYIAYTVSSSHGLYSIKEGQKNGELNKNYIPSGAQEYSNIVKLSDLTKSKGNYYYLWIHALDAATYKNYTRVNAQIKLK